MGQQGETYTVHLRRNTTSEPWGFRLQGGLDFQTPLSVQSVNPAGVAERGGLQPSDAVLSINGQSCEALDHDDAKRLIIMAGLDVNIVIQRGAVNVWKPKVTPMSELRSGGQQQHYGGPDGEQYVQRTSLAADKQESIKVGSAHNRSARPFPGFGGQSSVGSSGGSQPSQAYQPAAANYGNQYGANMSQGPGGYQPNQGQSQGYGAPSGQSYPGQQNYSANASSASSALGSHVCERGVAIPGYRRVSPSIPTTSEPSPAPGGGSAPSPGGPSGFRSVKAPVFDPSKVAPQIKNHPVCKACNQQIIGVFVKVCGEPLHAECFKCAACARSLKNQGYYEHGGQLYCDNHGPSAQ